MKHTIEVVGLGGGDINQLSLGIYRKLKEHANPIFVRTKDHPVVQTLQEEGVTFHSYDEIYEQYPDFQTVYEEIANSLYREAEEGSIIYAVPGHPMLAEKTVQLLLAQQEVEVKIIGGQSFLDDLFSVLQIDPIDGFQFVDATSFRRDELEYRQHLIFCQVYDQMVASEVKLELLEDLPPEYPVTIVDAVGSSDERIKTVALEELDRSVEFSNLMSVYVPPAISLELNHKFYRLHDVIRTLRGPNGCPWDQKQTHTSLRRYLIEEAYELIDAINKEDEENLIEELGDVLLQVMLHSQIGEDEGYFTIEDVIRSVTEKMIRRHPHVFGDEVLETEEELRDSWAAIKQEEKKEQSRTHTEEDAMVPQLMKAAKIGQTKEVAVSELEQLLAKLDQKEGQSEQYEAAIGEILFAIASYAGYHKINPEIALHQVIDKKQSTDKGSER
ncbi:MazG family protein [Terribacillus sp. DMT04]|uniref:MazG family protein n=1 Tax=Terribacillus sp. DMT04 TaxID=2850441 RepID=UPI001C2BFA25|nr:MazG family protein [Terribacillus sp. DMT04]QXE01803.1 MazG family protein [Terribacillus sp. DMT04]